MADGQRDETAESRRLLGWSGRAYPTWCALAACAALSSACGGSSGPRGDATPDGPDAEAPQDDAGNAAESCGPSLDTAAACVDPARLSTDVRFVAASRPPGSAHWQSVQDLCAARFEQYGFTVERQRYASGVNVIGTRRGAQAPDARVIVSAHYDHIPDCSGADDNATGVAALLETARVVADVQLARTLVLACWDQEELGLIGAKAYAARAKIDGDEIVVMTSLEMLGYRDTAPNTQTVPAGFDLLFPAQYQAVAAREFRADFVSLIALDSAMPLAQAFERRANDNGLPSSLITLTPTMAASPLLADLSRSDHAAFWLEGFPALMVTDTSNFRYAQYHCRNGDDAPERLDFGFLTAITRASVAAHLEIVGVM